MRYLRYILLCVASLFLSIMMPAQKLTPLPTSSQITVGALPNGISYYLVANATNKGSADFALIQKGASDREAARLPLRSIPNFQQRAPYKFLADKGVGYSRDGFVTVSSDATTYRFERIPMGDSGAVDSTLMLLFNMADMYAHEQAVVVSGDIDPDAMLQKISLFSMLVSPRSASPKAPEYRWEPADSAMFTFLDIPSRTSFVSAMYQFPRTPEENMNTVQPLVSRLYSSLLRTILTNRIREQMRTRNLPLSGIEYVYRSSSEGPGNEHYTITLHTKANCLADAAEVLGQALSDLDRNGASPEEYKDAKDAFSSNLGSLGALRYSQNASFVDMCEAAFLYGSNLAPAKTVIDFFADRQIPAEKELSLFNNFVSALLDPQANLSVVCIGDYKGGYDQLKSAFDSAWKHPAIPEDEHFHASRGDTLSLVSFAPKVKLKSEQAEPISGGKIWTFSNGLKVVFRQMPTPGRIRYSLMIRGGYASVPDLSRGEGAFVGDLLGLSRVGGKSCYDFRKMLSSNGITMKPTVSLSDLRISGNAPSNRMQLVLRSLLTVANVRQPDPEAFAYYKLCEAVREEGQRGETEGIRTAIDRIMFPDYPYSPWRDVKALRDNLPDRAELYFNNQFLRVNDGVLTIIGDMNEDYLKKMLVKWLGAFRTTGTGFAPRPKIQQTLRTGTSTYVVNSNDLEDVYDGSVNVLMSAAIPFSTDKYMAFKMAGFLLRKSIVRELADTGFYVEMQDDVSLYPQERMEILIRCKAADPRGLPDGMVADTPLTVLDQVRKALGEATGKTLSKQELSTYKDLLNNYFLSLIPRPDFVEQSLLLRYSEGKDMVTRYRERINAISAEEVQAILQALRKGCNIEYVVE